MPPHADTQFRDPGDAAEHPFEWDPNAENEPEHITDEIQLENFIRVLQTAQQLARECEKENSKMTKRPKMYVKNAPRTKRRWRKAQGEYQAAGGKLITNWFQRKGSRPGPKTNGGEDVREEINPRRDSEAEGDEMLDSEAEGTQSRISGTQVMSQLHHMHDGSP